MGWTRSMTCGATTYGALGARANGDDVGAAWDAIAARMGTPLARAVEAAVDKPTLPRPNNRWVAAQAAKQRDGAVAVESTAGAKHAAVLDAARGVEHAAHGPREGVR